MFILSFVSLRLSIREAFKFRDRPAIAAAKRKTSRVPGKKGSP